MRAEFLLEREEIVPLFIATTPQRDGEVAPRALRRIALVCAAATGVLTAMCLYYRLPPPLITLAIVTVLYGVAAARS